MLEAFYNRARYLGFAQWGTVDLRSHDPQNAQWLREFVAAGHHGTMTWMEETLERRVHPRSLWPEANSAIVLGFNYGPETDPMETLDQGDIATISVYARHKDYHGLIKGKLKELAGLAARDLDADVKVFVDTAPLMEKPLAAHAGLGWQGKHTNLVSRDFGSWMFLGVILTQAVLPDMPITAPQDHCGGCRACLDICPTQAFPAPYKLDARRCISYLTIEHKGPVDLDLREAMGNRIYGCDDCLAVCPWNKFAVAATELKLKAKDDLNAPDLRSLAALSEADFRKKFAGSPIKRIGHARFLRNVLYAIGNSNRPDLRSAAQVHISHKDPVTAEAAQWAVSRLAPR